MYLSDTLAYGVQIGWTYIQMFLRQFQFSLDSLSTGAVLLPCLISPLLHSQKCLDLNDKWPVTLGRSNWGIEAASYSCLNHWSFSRRGGGIHIWWAKKFTKRRLSCAVGQGPHCRGHQEMLRRLVLTPARASPPNGTAQSYYFPIRKLDSLRV